MPEVGRTVDFIDPVTAKRRPGQIKTVHGSDIVDIRGADDKLYTGMYVNPGEMSVRQYDPTLLANLELYLDASRIAPVADATALAQWDDLSGNGRHVVQAVGAKQPLYRNANPNLISYGYATADVNAFVSQQDPGSIVTLTQETITVRNVGTRAVKAVTNGFGPYEGIKTPTYDVAVSAGVQVTLSVWVYSSVICTLRVQLLGAIDGVFVGSNSPVAANTWTRISATGTPTSTQNCMFYLDTGPTNDGALALIMQDLQVELGPVATAWVAPVTLPNNLPTVQFDGVDDGIKTGIVDMVQPRTHYVVYQAPQLGRDQHILSSDDGAKRGDIWVAANRAASIYGGLSVLDVAGSIGDNSSNHIITGVFNTANSFVVFDGVKSISADAGSHAIGAFQLGQFAINNNPLAGSIAAVLVFSEAHSDSTRKRIEKWLGSKYGIAVAA